MKRKLTMFLALFLMGIGIVMAQTQVRGTIVDEAGIPIIGATVQVKGTAQGTITDLDGRFSLSAPANGTLVISYVGLKTQEVPVSPTVNVTLLPDTELLDEVVVTALGIKRRPRELSYATTTVDTDELTKTKSSNAATAMVGKVSGLQINTVNNGVNPDTRVVLRGNRSLLGNNQALVVIDGYPASRGALDRINTDDIASINVLKGANASALYGSEAANGVLMITTKQGSGKFKTILSSTLQFESISYMPQFQDQFGSGGFPDGTLWPLENVNWGPRYDGRMVAASETLDNGEVWEVPFWPIKNAYKQFFQTGLTSRNGVTLSAGDDRGDFLVSLDHSDTKGIVPKDQFNKTNFRLKASKNYGKLSIGGNLSFFRSYANTVDSQAGRQDRPVYWNVINTPLHIPLAEMKNWRDGKFTRNEVSYYRFYENPWFIVDTQREKNEFRDLTAIVDFNYKFTDWLSASVRSGYTFTSSTYKEEDAGFNYAFHLQHVYSEMDPYGPKTSDLISAGQRFNTDALLTLDKPLNDNFTLKAIAGYNMRYVDYKSVNVGGENLIIPDFYNVSTRTGQLLGGAYTERESKMGLYADFTLGFRDYLFFNVTGRNDWSSTLPENNRSFFYPGVGVSFVASQAFPNLVSDSGLTYLKANFNITKTGNNTVPYKVNSIFYAPDNFPYANTTGLSQSAEVSDPELNPEFTTSVEAGLEFAFFANRLSGSITAYKTNTTDQLVPIDVSLASGADRLFTNLGEIQNRGLELDLNGTIISNSAFSWKLGFNYSGYDSKVISLKDGVEELGIGGFTNNSAYIIAKVGSPYPMIRTTSYLRDDQGRVIVDDKGDPIQDTENQIQGKTTPDYVLGFNTRVSYKNFELYAVMDYRTGHVFYNSLVDALEFTGLTMHSVTAGRKPFVFPNSSYQVGTDSNGDPVYQANTDRLTSGGGNAFWDKYNEVKENYVTDATTLKLREVSLNYNFKQPALNRIGIENILLGVFGRNLLTFRPKANVYTDPEFGYTTGNTIGIGTQAQTPPTRIYGVNLSVTF